MSKTVNQANNKRWTVLIYGALTNAVVVALQTMSLSVLLPAITHDFSLSVTQAGLLWGITSLPTIFSSFIAGTLIDRFGSKRILIISSFLVGLFGALRGLAPNYTILMITVLFFGFFSPFITIGNIKNAGNWFKNRDLGIANGVLSLGMALGFFAGSMISASYISPLVGGWRNTFLLFGFFAILMMLPWFFMPSSSGERKKQSTIAPEESSVSKIKHVSQIKNVFLLGLTILCFNGAAQGFLGYIPLFLRNSGWAVNSADSLAASFHLASMIFVIPLTLLSDRLGDRKKILLPLILFSSLGIGFFILFEGGLLWLAVLLAGFARDGVMAILFTMTLETRGVTENYAGTASSFMVIFASLGGLLSPPLGNSFAAIAPRFPFVLWTILCIIGFICILLIKKEKLSQADQTA